MVTLKRYGLNYTQEGLINKNYIAERITAFPSNYTGKLPQRGEINKARGTAPGFGTKYLGLNSFRSNIRCT
jgi:hypothetical protein